MLHHDLVTAPGRAPDRWILFLHGILGRGANWGGFARRLLPELPGWGAILVDLRAHGSSRQEAPPDTLEAAAADLGPIVDARPVRAVLGHSFGGKVAIELARRRDVETLFIVDSLPAARPERRGSEGTMRVVRVLETMPAHFLDRASFVRYVTDMGFTEPLAAWLSQNLEPLSGGYELGVDLDRIRALLDDFFERELWPELDPPPDATTAHLVIGGRSTVFSADDVDRAVDVAATHGSVHVHVLPNADHWVHVDDEAGLRRIVVEALC